MIAIYQLQMKSFSYRSYLSKGCAIIVIIQQGSIIAIMIMANNISILLQCTYISVFTAILLINFFVT